MIFTSEYTEHNDTDDSLQFKRYILDFSILDLTN